ncbi:hypothetical protein [Rhizorhabdus argentea]|uniref:hypothetical protein n=1 Tax=Rhizorhabdus argentea TaxID=1387174 RepID=UPI0030ECA62B
MKTQGKGEQGKTGRGKNAPSTGNPDNRAGQAAKGAAGIKARATRVTAVAGEKLKGSSAAARAASRKAAEGVDAFPVAALVGGVALGAVIGALLPRTRQEEQLLGSIGGSINDKAKGAASAAREAGQAKLDELGISSNSAGKTVGKLIDSIAQIAETAGSAAVEAVRH